MANLLLDAPIKEPYKAQSKNSLYTILESAVGEEQIDLLSTLLPQSKQEDIDNALIVSIRGVFTETLSLILKYKPKLEHVGKDTFTALDKAIHFKNKRYIQLLVEAGANLDTPYRHKTHQNKTPHASQFTAREIIAHRFPEIYLPAKRG